MNAVAHNTVVDARLWLAALLHVVWLGSAFGQTGPATRPATAEPATAPAERFLSDEEFLQIGQEFDLDGFIKGLNPPTVEDILKSLEPIPTREQILEDLKHPERQPKPPTLPQDVRKQVDELTEQIEELERQGATGKDPSAQLRALDGAIRLAGRVIQLLTDAGQPQDRYELVDARQRAAELTHLRTLPAHGREVLVAARRRDAEVEQLATNGAYVAAVAIARSQLAIRRHWLSGDHPDVASTLNILASFLQFRGALAQAEPLHRESLAMCLRLFPGDHPHVAASLHGLAYALKVRGALAEAEPLYREALAMHKRLFPGDHLQVASSLNNLAGILMVRGALAEAEPLYREALAMRQRLFPGDHPYVATSLGSLALLLRNRGVLAEAEPLCREALAMYRRLFSGDHLYVATSLNNLADILQVRGALAEAEALYREALAMRQRLLPGDHSDVAASLNNIAVILHARGAPAQAESFSREALAMYKRLFSGDHPRVATSLNNLASFLQARGALAEAEPLLRESLAMRQRLFPGDHLNVAAGLNNLAFVLNARGALAEAEPLYREALAMKRRLFPGDHSEVATALNNVANNLQARGALAKAELLYRESLAMWQRLFRSDHPRVATGLNNLAAILATRGASDEAEPLFRESLAMKRRLFPGDHPEVAAGLSSVAGVVRTRGALDEVEPLCREALAMYQRLFPDDHPDVAGSLHKLAQVLEARRALDEAEPLYREALAMSEKLRTRIVGEEKARAMYSEKLNLTSRAGAYAAVLARLDRGSEALHVLERGRGRVLLDLLARQDRDLIAEGRDRADQAGIRRLEKALRTEEQARIDMHTAETLVVGRRRERDTLEKRSALDAAEQARRLAEYDQRIVALLDDVKKKRQQLAAAGTAVLVELRGLFPAADPLPTEEIIAQLAPDETVLAFAWMDDVVLAATAAPGGSDAHILADGRDAVARLNELARRLRQSLAQRPSLPVDKRDMSATAELLATLLPEPLRKQMASAKRLIVLPDGPLHGIPLEALLAGEEGRWQVVYAPSATAYVRWKGPRDQATKGSRDFTVVVVGDPVFDRDRPEPQYPKHGVAIAMVADGLNAASAGLQRGDVILSYDARKVADFNELVTTLGAVSKEVETGKRSADERVAVRYWRDGKVLGTTLAPGRMGVRLDRGTPGEALEYFAMRSRGEEEKVGQYSMLDQVRLHGGTLSPLPGTGREAKAIAKVVRAAGGKASVLVKEDATLGRLATAVQGKRIVHIAAHGLTGSSERPYDASLALTQPETPSPDDFGFLTLDDLIRKWQGKLRGCDLVVLSACDTQRGVKHGDSVMALPWGFFYAGAPTVVASLWKVDDTATALLMIRFYENLLGQYDISRGNYAAGTPMPKAEALREAKRWLRASPKGEIRAAIAGLGTPASGARAKLDTKPGGGPRPPRDEYDFSHPHYWAAFILIGDHD